MGRVSAERAELLRLRGYLLLLIGGAISAIGNGMQFIATTWLALELTGAGYAVAIVLLMRTLPGLVLAPVLGVAVDRFDRRLLSIATDLISALALFAVPALWFGGVLQAWHVYMAEFVLAVCETTHHPANAALVREVVPDRLLLTANATSRSATQTGLILGAAGAGLLIAVWPAISAMLLNALSFAIAALFTFGVRRLHTFTPAPRSASGVFGDLSDGLRYVRAHPRLIAPYVVHTLLFTTISTINTLLPTFAKDVLRVGATGFGLIDAAWAVGAVAGSIALPVLVVRAGLPRVSAVAPFGIALGLLFFSAANGLVWALAGYAFSGVFHQLGMLSAITSAQTMTDNAYQGRVQNLFRTLGALLSLLIYATIGASLGAVSQRWFYALQALVVCCAGVIAWRDLRRHCSGRPIEIA
jgi:MFS transporter, DHA3 family, macrolide efflux protein